MVDIRGIKNILRDECITCNIRNKKENGNRCKNCLFMLNGGNDIIVSTTSKKFGIPINIKKSHLYYFLYYPDLKWKFPKLPNNDKLGNSKESKKFRWIIHHEDENHFNDHKKNLKLILNTEHKSIHNLKYNPMFDLKNRIKKSETDKLKVKNRTHIFITDNPMKKLNSINKLKNGINLRIKNKTHNFIINNPNVNTPKQLNLKKWLLNLKIGNYKITEKLSRELYYSVSSSLKTGIKCLIKRDNIQNISLIKKDNRWIIVKGEDN